MNAQELTPIQTLEFLQQKATDCIRLAEHTKQLIETYHASYHDGPTFLNCPKGSCRETAAILFEVTRPYEPKPGNMD